MHCILLANFLFPKTFKKPSKTYSNLICWFRVVSNTIYNAHKYPFLINQSIFNHHIRTHHISNIYLLNYLTMLKYVFWLEMTQKQTRVMQCLRVTNFSILVNFHAISALLCLSVKIRSVGSRGIMWYLDCLKIRIVV